MPAILVVLAAMVISVGGFVVVGNASKDDRGATGCTGSMPVRLAASTDVAPLLEAATRALERADAEVDGVCVAFEVEPGPSAAVADALAAEPEADAQALKQIAGATGGRSYIARRATDIGSVFLDAMLAR